ncbi:APC membrane recruitment protein 1-like [Poeciliopsis prolifica]|uniref:APC membrane recruitment protein 1-like n=1 Tax=Poeciliopsis prolifica TaxID=188132 RepID=UPI0024139CD0|nr:APC membrane recruitment protein 1-like [Poeciliopsis prolifica]
MSSCKAEELPSDGKDSPPAASQPLRTEPDIVPEELLSDPIHETVKSQKAGKFKRTALTFFGVRKSICILPSFFGGRSKNQNKWSFKKGIGKSRTHDGLCKVSDDKALRSGHTSSGDFEYHIHRDGAGDLHSGCQGECNHPTPDQKSLTLGRQRKGFRSLFQSFRHHRSQRNNDTSEASAVSSPQCKKEVPVVQCNTNRSATEFLECDHDVPEFVEDLCDISIGLECSHADAKSKESSMEKECPKSEPQLSDDKYKDANLKAVPSGGYDNSCRRSSEPCLKLQTASETPAGSSDQLNLIFGEVSSLKSFDSLTGCGDIIADQEDDSITESTVSGERSRNGGKRASCYLTYQGGGEEMASPEDLDGTCLQDFWGSNTSEVVCYSCDPEQTEMSAELTSLHNADALNSSTQQAGAMDTSSIADVLTPQSEHQESGPNSDEGYYDSTTPGPEEGQEKRSGRLPRDSYSGDALYELFAPDESLISPHYENKSQPPSSKHSDYLTEPVSSTDPAFVPKISHLQISADLYKDDFLEMPSSFSTNQDVGVNEICNLNLKPQILVNTNNLKAKIFNENEGMLASADKNTKPINAELEKRCSGLSFGSASDPDFETFCEPKEEHIEENKPVALPYKNINSQSEECNSYIEDGQTVCFSQALLDYTKHTQLLCKLGSEVDDLERSSAFTPNMEALPTIVTFDVVDLRNEGEYDEQIHMELEEDVSSPYQEFEESYLQKDAFAECDYQMLDLYEQNLISNTWAVARHPRHLGLTRVSQSTSNQLSLDRRSRSLDTDSLELPETYRENRPAVSSEQDSERNCSPYYRKKIVLSASEVRDCSNVTSLSWEKKSEVTVTDETTKNIQSLSQAHKQPQYFCSASDDLSCDLVSQNPELYSRQCHLPLRSDCCLPYGTFGMKEEESDDVFRQSPAKLHSHSQGSKDRALTDREVLSHARSPLNSPSVKENTVIFSEAKGDGVTPVTCNNHSEATCN